MQTTNRFERVLIANRGEIARRIIRTLDRLGIDSIAVYSSGDADAPHAREATLAVELGPDPAAESYLNIDAIIAAATSTGAQAIHPGYGFLSESVEFARACERAGIAFIGPGVHAIDVMGDKARSREHVHAAGVPIVPGFSAADMSDEEVERRARDIGFPILIKPSAGGGGKGMEIVAAANDLRPALESARRLARSAFGDDTLIIERLIERPRHVEVQVFGDTHGRVIALGERECTLQRRHQKVIEEAPSPAIDAGTRARLLEAAVQAARSVNYVGAGTVEFLVDAEQPNEFFFIEMNTRLQVEHPVTELVTGLDLVAWQVDVAAGAALPESGPKSRGHAVEARIYAESPERGFLPSVGTVLRFTPPRNTRVDSAVETGSRVSAFYDPMIGKIIAHGDTRDEALDRLDRALAATVILGVDTNVGLLRRLVQDANVRAGDMHTGLIDDLLPLEPATVSDAMLQAAARAHGRTAERRARQTLGASSPWNTVTRGWRVGMEPVPPEPLVFVADDGREFLVARRHGFDDDVAVDVPVDVDAEGNLWVCEGGSTVRLRVVSRREQTLRALTTVTSVSARPDCVAPMPGAVTSILVEHGARVHAGQPLLAIEAMKMEHPVVAPFDGVVNLLVSMGAQVQRDDVVARVEPDEEAS